MTTPVPVEATASADEPMIKARSGSSYCGRLCYILETRERGYESLALLNISPSGSLNSTSSIFRSEYIDISYGCSNLIYIAKLSSEKLSSSQEKATDSLF